MRRTDKLLFGLGLFSILLSGCSSNNTGGDPSDIVDYPRFSPDGKTVEYGYYPQTVVDDASLVSKLDQLPSPTSKGWYFYKDSYYVKINAMPYSNRYTFDNGETIENSKAYWFKCEPITWRVLSFKNGQYLVLSNMLLDTCDFYDSTSTRTIGGKTIHPNNYEYSNVRTWLNDNFFDSAFRIDNSYVQTTNVDNSASTTNKKDNRYVCNDTSDKVFLLSYKDYQNADYELEHDVQRRTVATDWARARGAYLSTTAYSYKNTGNYWTRSPYETVTSSLDTYVSYIATSGDYSSISEVNSSYYSVRPAITIKIT